MVQVKLSFAFILGAAAIAHVQVVALPVAGIELLDIRNTLSTSHVATGPNIFNRALHSDSDDSTKGASTR
jgi:hypothetical protein